MDLLSDPVPSVHVPFAVYKEVLSSIDDELWDDDFRHIRGKSCVKRITASGERVPDTGPVTAGLYEITGPDGDVMFICSGIPVTGPDVLSTSVPLSRRKRSGGKKETSTCSVDVVDVAAAKKNP